MSEPSLRAADVKTDPAFQPRPKTSGLEVVIGVDNLLGIAWLSRGTEVAAAVGRVLLSGGDVAGTGFLVGPDLLITNHHVLPNAAAAAGATLELNYQLTWSGQPAPVRTHQLTTLERTDSTLDYSLVRVDGNPGDIVGFIDPTDRSTPTINEPVVIIQHPNGERKQIALQDNQVSAVFGDRLQYTTDTQPGASGSPIFNNRWEIVGLHHAGGDLPGPTGALTTTNEGILFNALVRAADGLLGASSHLLLLVTGDLRRSLRDFVETGPDVVATAQSLLIEQPTLSDDIAAEGDPRAAADPDQSTVVAGIASALALALAFTPALLNGFHPVAATPPGPDPALRSLLAPIDTAETDPAKAYDLATSALNHRLDNMPDIRGLEPGPPSPRRTVRLFLRALTIGAQAISKDP